ncbi:restriction endonuclease subunit M [Mesorhizobium loti]|nr:class I SAM-dependent DNA methyltransferase [Mesorhizobium loti]PLP55473.1 restriction endonuclease subunit M [Mesorhizobium loti]
MDDKTAQQAKTLANFVWQIAETLRGDFKQSEYGKVILPFVVLRRLDCILEPSKEAVLKAHATLPQGIDEQTRDMMLYSAASAQFGSHSRNLLVYNTSQLDFKRISSQNAGDVHENLVAYIREFSDTVRDVFLDKFRFTDQLKRLNEAAILWKVFEQFAKLDLRPQSVSTLAMGYLFEDLIRRFSEISNETAGEHFTPREVIRLIVDLLLVNDAQALTGKGIIRQVYDAACGTGGMLALTEEGMKNLNPDIRVELFGQELNGESFGICKSDMLVTGHDPENIAFGNTLTHDAHKGRQFHYMLSNPPYGVDWKKYADPIKDEHERLGEDGRFGAGLPRISDGQLLFLQHMISKMREDEAGSRIGIVMNGSPLFTGGAGSGESEIRRWMLEKDWIEAIVALPTDLFYNTGIQTYVWLLTNRKRRERVGRVQLIDASGEQFWKPMRKSLGSKRREIRDEARETIAHIFHEMANGGGPWAEVSKIFNTTDFGYREIKVERPLKLNFQASAERIERLKLAKPFLKLDPAEQDDVLNVVANRLPDALFKDRPSFEVALTKALKGAGVKIAAPIKKAILSALSERDETAAICLDSYGRPEPDPELRDYELVPLKEGWKTYVAREVAPFVPDAWVDETHRDDTDKGVGRVGYEINFNRYFYRYVPPRPLAEIDAELKALEADIAGLLKEVAG